MDIISKILNVQITPQMKEHAKTIISAPKVLKIKSLISKPNSK